MNMGLFTNDFTSPPPPCLFTPLLDYGYYTSYNYPIVFSEDFTMVYYLTYQSDSKQSEILYASHHYKKCFVSRFYKR